MIIQFCYDSKDACSRFGELILIDMRF